MAEELRMATEIATASIRCVDNVIQALLKMLEERGGVEQDKKALKNFLNYVEKGGTLMTVPVSQEVAEAFEKKLQKTDILSCRTQLRTSPGIYKYIYKAEDQHFMDLLIDDMKKDGHQLIESFNFSEAVVNDRKQTQENTKQKKAEKTKVNKKTKDNTTSKKQGNPPAEDKTSEPEAVELSQKPATDPRFTEAEIMDFFY